MHQQSTETGFMLVIKTVNQKCRPSPRCPYPIAPSSIALRCIKTRNGLLLQSKHMHIQSILSKLRMPQLQMRPKRYAHTTIWVRKTLSCFTASQVEDSV